MATTEQIAQEMSDFHELLDQSLIPLVNRKAKFGDPRRFAVIIPSEFLRGIKQIRIGNMFAGIPNEGEKIPFDTLEEVFADWRVD